MNKKLNANKSRNTIITVENVLDNDIIKSRNYKKGEYSE